MNKGYNCSKETCLRNQKQVIQSWRRWTRFRRGVHGSVIWPHPPTETITFLSSIKAILCHCMHLCVFFTTLVPVVSLLSCLLLAGFSCIYSPLPWLFMFDSWIRGKINLYCSVSTLVETESNVLLPHNSNAIYTLTISKSEHINYVVPI